MLTRSFIVLLMSFFFCNIIQASGPLNGKPLYIEGSLSYPFYKYYNQYAFSSKSISPGLAVNIGQHRFPVYLEYIYNSPIKYTYRNHSIQNSFQEIGLRYSLNGLSYIIPYGVDPYIGVGLAHQKTIYEKRELSESGNGEIALTEAYSKSNYKLSAGIKFGNNKLTFGIHYDYLPSLVKVNIVEGEGLPIYNTQHLISARVGYRFSLTNKEKIKCPRFNTRMKRTLPF